MENYILCLIGISDIVIIYFKTSLLQETCWKSFVLPEEHSMYCLVLYIHITKLDYKDYEGKR